ncbi:hypothetical protein KQI36_15960 [Clostridium senegalense]|uniref:hypothetical protein n=1 Tax=Clostridium senegalense TaxID=1465809 RepID=UPI001C112245|nr:hypothetical protein [Clostridium senegalense]MBU5228127.1 hypothetical protein [Clostridium senegalense]
MKLTDYLIFAVIIISSIALPVKIRQDKMLKAEELKIIYNEVVDNSVKDAASMLLEADDNDSLETLSEGRKINFKQSNLNLDKSLWRFYQTLYLNLNIEDNFAGQEAIKSKIPIKLAVGYDGYYINSWQEIKVGKEIKEVWHPKSSFMYFDKKNNLNINLTLDDTVYLLDNQGNKEEFEAEDLIGKYDNILFSKDIDNFNKIRKQIIIEKIQKDLELYSSVNNKIAVTNGLEYTFQLPTIDERAINDITFIAFFQGNMLNGIDMYNTYGLGVARIVRQKYIYGCTDGNGKKYYHNNTCTKNYNFDLIFDNERDAASNGYYPHECIFQNK